jgi:hypothetical protein
MAGTPHTRGFQTAVDPLDQATPGTGRRPGDPDWLIAWFDIPSKMVYNPSVSAFASLVEQGYTGK